MTASWLALEPVGDDVVWALSTPEGVVDASLVAGTADLRAELLAAVPGTREDLWAGAWADPGREADLAHRAGSVLVPPVVRARLGPGTTLHVAARGWLASVPWDLLVVDPHRGTRLLERTQVVGALPPTVERAVAPTAAADGPAVRVVDPGPTSVGRLYPGTPESWWERCRDEEDVMPLPGASLDGEGLGELLRAGAPARFLYFGHAVGGTPDAPASAGLVLTGSDGRPDVFTAYAWLGDPTSYPAPPRVAIVACGSDDGHHVEQSGLPVAAVHAGAQLVTATRWTLPVDAARGDDCPTTRLGLAVDAAHAAPDPLAALRDWQLERLAAWRAGGRRDDAPLLWAALVTYRAGDD